jgi:salicylate hydroxylase
MPGELRVAVAGGGIGGLVLAIALEAHGVEVAVFEQAGEHREIGAGVALSGNATRLLHRLGLEEALAAVATEPSALVFRRWDDGRVIADHPVGRGGWYRDEVGAPYYGVHRVDLLRVLAEALPPGVVRLGRRTTGVRRRDGEAVVELEDGETAAAHVVVGADGVHSVVRRHVAGADAPAVFSGTVGYRGLVPVGDLPSLPDVTPLQFWAGPGRHLLHYSVSGGRVVNFLAVVRQARWTGETWSEPCPVQDAVDAFAGWHPAVTEMVGAIGEMTRWALHDRAPLERWADDRVVLLGDAAHAMLPHQGQGANQTIEDAVLLADLLAAASPADVPAALRRYESVRRPRTRRVQRWSRMVADRMHLPDGPEAEARDAGLATVPDDIGWIHRYDVQDAAAAHAHG